MKKIKELALGTFLFLAFSASAYAATAHFNYGVSTLDVYPSAGAFADAYTFELIGANSSIDYTVTPITKTIDVGGSILSTYNFQSGAFGFTYGLYDSVDTLITDSSSLAAGIYTLKVSGIANGIYGGYYRINANVAIVPVPEPESTLLMLLGLSAIGLASLRKSQKA